MRHSAKAHNLKLFDLDSPDQGIVHVISPELGIVQPIYRLFVLIATLVRKVHLVLWHGELVPQIRSMHLQRKR